MRIPKALLFLSLLLPAGLADLEAAFSRAARGGIAGGAELADGVHWFGRHNSFVYGEIGAAAARCLSGRAARPA